ncbi:hypothetical protein NDU88_000216 [Pleurodeles waltl]|uniref:Uncharacterized protein n=1 Tax=Pleurodeles waltl TaxID=8319 RepID=A0AAV7U2W0_PLEWA|nr:hypothetical protein NDU88_000216 [Pleurodeles waltl]
MLWEVRDTIPHVSVPTQLHDQVADRLCNCQQQNDRMSRKRRARIRDIQVGGSVLVKNRQPGVKCKLPFESSPWTVVRVRGTKITAERGREVLTSNVSWVKRYHRNVREQGRSQMAGHEPCEDGEFGIILLAKESYLSEQQRPFKEVPGMTGAPVSNEADCDTRGARADLLPGSPTSDVVSRKASPAAATKNCLAVSPGRGRWHLRVSGLTG